MVDHSGSTTEPQDAFGELARIILADHSLESVMDRVAQLTKDTVPGAHEVSVTLVERGQSKTVAFTGSLAAKLDERQYRARLRSVPRQHRGWRADPDLRHDR